jgi:PHD/YefM family antitoxin component YafN of YafNO toxin-antitoxin module
MNVIPAPEIKRRGIGAVESYLGAGPVHVIRNNRPEYVVLKEDDYQNLLHELAEARLAASEEDFKTGRVHHGTAADLLAELD